MPPAERIELGYVSGVFGVKGEVRLFLHDRDSRTLYAPTQVTLVGPDGTERAVELRARSGAGGRVLARMEGVTSREAAAAWKGWRIQIPRTDLPALEDDEFYVHAVLGLPVFVEGVQVGNVRAVHDSGPHQIFEVKLGTGALGFVPVLRTHVLAVDPPRGVDVAPGALAELS